MAIVDLLKDLAYAIRIVPPPGAPHTDLGVPISFTLTPPPASLDTIQAGDVKAIWLTKDVRFADALGAPGTIDLSTYLTDSTRIHGGQPVVAPDLGADVPLPTAAGFVLPLPALTKPATLPNPTPPANDLMAGTPGVLGQLAGAVPIPVEAPISVSVTWTVKKRKDDGTFEDAREGTDFVAPKGLKAPTLDLVFLATGVKDLATGFSPLVRFEISADVEVKALGQSSGVVTVPPQPPPPLPRVGIGLDVPSILGIPFVVALFRHGNYATEDSGPGAVLLAVPENSVLKNAVDLAPVLDTLRDTLKRLQSFQSDAVSGNFATFLLGLDTLIGALNGQPKFQFLVGKCPDLERIIFAESGWRIFPPRLGGSLNAEDMLSSVILVGVPKRGVKLWGDENYREDLDHKFSLELFTGAALWASIRDFRFVINISDMVVSPPIGAPGVGTVVNLSRDPGFGADINDKISSIDYRSLP